MLTLKNEVLHRILLRRTKVQQADVLALPPRWVQGGHWERGAGCG